MTTVAARRFSGLVVIGLIASGVMLNGMSDLQLMFGERKLAQLAREIPDQIWTDPATYVGARWWLENDGDVDRVHVALSPPGGLYLFSAKPRRPVPADWPIRSRPTDWTLIAAYEAPERPVVSLLRGLGLFGFLPRALSQKLAPQPREVILLRAPPPDPDK